MAQTTSTQLGPTAIAHPAINSPPSNEKPQTSATQLGPSAIAPPAVYVANDEDDLVFTDIPPFPEDVPTAPLLRLSLQKLAAGDTDEVERLWRASCDLGFFYLDLRDSGDAEGKRDSAHDLSSPAPQSEEIPDGEINGSALYKDAQSLFNLGTQVFALPVSEKQKYDFKDQGSYFGYKGYGAGVIDAAGTRDRNEFYNVSKDDILGLSEALPAPGVLKDGGNRQWLRRFMVRSHAVVELVLGVLNEKMGLPPGTLQGLHRLRGVSGDQVRWVRSPAQVSLLRYHCD